MSWVILCRIVGHDPIRMTVGRLGYVAWYRCRRGCGWQAIRKGAP